MQRRAFRLACFLLGLKPLTLCRLPGTKGFAVLPRRWVVSGTSGWLGWWRRLSQDYERLPEVSGTGVVLATIRIMGHRTAYPNRECRPVPSFLGRTFKALNGPASSGKGHPLSFTDKSLTILTSW